MSKTRDTGYLNNILQYTPTGVSFVSGSTTLLSVNSSGNLTTTGTITAQTLVVQTVTSSISFVTGSTKFGVLSSNTHQFTGSMYVTGGFYVSASAFQIISPSTTYGGAINLINTSNNKQWNITNVGSGTGARSGNFEINNNAIDILAISQSGNVGIGTATPARKFVVQDTSADPFISIMGAYPNQGGILFGDVTYNDASCAIRLDRTNNALWFSTSGASNEKMRITADGYTKMSSTGTYALSTGYYHEFYGGAANGYTLIVTSNVATPLSQYVFDIRFSAATPNNTNARFLHCSDATATRAIIRSNGGLANYQSNNADLSDIRTKKDIISLESYWNKFKALEIVKYKYKDQTHDDFNIGVIAQQVESVAPEFVDVDGWEKNDIESESPLKSIYTKDLYHATIKVLQEAITKIETLEAENDTLKEILQRNNIQ